MSFKNRFAILGTGFLIFAAVPMAPAAQTAQEKDSRPVQQDRANSTKRKQASQSNLSRSPAASKDTVRQIQTALKSRGFDPGPVDGLMGPKTRMAIRNFQSGQGMTATGIIDEPTLTALQIETKPPAGSDSNPQQTTGNIGNAQLPRPENQIPEALPRTQEAPGDIGVGPTAYDIEDVRQAQMALKNRGYDPGELNGMISSKTQDAIRQFQTANGIPVTGKLDARTQAALGITIKGTDQEQRRTSPGGPSESDHDR